MGLVVRVFGCDNCDKRFELMQDRDEPPPTECPFCSTPEVQGPIPSTTAIGARTRSKAVDGMYRQHEAASEYRAEIAGDPSLKQTDMKDGFYGGGLREGDVAAQTAADNTVVGKFMRENGTNGWGLGMQTADLVAAAKVGPHARAGTGGDTLKQIATNNFGGKGIPPTPSSAAGGKWG